MGTMTVRSTYSLDAQTDAAIKRLSREWATSQAEVIRRVVQQASERQASEQRMTPAEVIEHLRQRPPFRSAEETTRLVKKMRSERRSESLAWSKKLDAMWKRAGR